MIEISYITVHGEHGSAIIVYTGKDEQTYLPRLLAQFRPGAKLTSYLRLQDMGLGIFVQP